MTALALAVVAVAVVAYRARLIVERRSSQRRHERVRRDIEHAERRVRAGLHPHSGQVTVLPTVRPRRGQR
jgi:hypothetical protein